MLLNEFKKLLVEENDGIVYGEVVFMQDSEAEEVMDMIKNDEDRAVEHLSQWDSGDYPAVYSDYRKKVGSDDTIYETDDYILAYNTGLGYVSLYVKLPTDDYEVDENNNGVDESNDKEMVGQYVKFQLKPDGKVFTGKVTNTSNDGVFVVGIRNSDGEKQYVGSLLSNSTFVLNSQLLQK